jgi:hypothetical protein
VLLTLLFTSNQSDARDAELARDRIEPIQTVPAQQPAQQPPVVVTVPQTTTVPVPVPVPAPAGTQSTTPAVTDTSIEVNIISKLTDDSELRSHPINVKFNNGTVTLSGLVPRESLKARAELVASSVKGVTRVVNEIAVQGQ